MNNVHPISPTITVADQPTEDDLKALKQQGYVGVINLRNAGEPEQPLSPEAEGQEVQALGMEYLHVGVGNPPLPEKGVQAVCEFLDRHAHEKVLVHCRKGGRAAALVLLHRALAEGWSADEAASKGKEHGIDVAGGPLTLVKQYLQDHQGQ